jgi:hypothetical protein
MNVYDKPTPEATEAWWVWQDHLGLCVVCAKVAAGVRIGRCPVGDDLVASWQEKIHAAG